MRRESRGVRDGQAGLSYSPLDRTRDVPVARETHPAPFRIPDHQTLGDGRGRRCGRHIDGGRGGGGGPPPPPAGENPVKCRVLSPLPPPGTAARPRAPRRASRGGPPPAASPDPAPRPVAQHRL